MVASVVNDSPAYLAGIRENDLITHVKGEPVNNITHPQLMHRLLSCGNEISVHVTPLNNTSIKEGEARKSVGKLLRKKPKRAQRIRVDKKPRKSSNLLRRLSGKAADIVPGTSSQKQTFIPRSVSSQDGVASATNQNVPTPGPCSSKQQLPSITVQMRVPAKSSNAHKRLSDFGLSSASSSSELPPVKSDIKSVRSPLAVDKQEHVPSKIVTTDEKAPQKTSTFQEIKNMVQRFSQTSSGSNSNSSSSSSNVEQKSPLPTLPSTHGNSRRNSSGITISPLARQSIGSVPSPNVPPQRPPPPQLQHDSSSISPKNSPTPSRKLSPSRLVRKIWHGATGQGESSGKDSTNK